MTRTERRRSARVNVCRVSRPEHIFFTEHDGHRGAVAVYNVGDDSQIPQVTEPWFLTFQATCKMRIAMVPEDLKKSGLDALGRSGARTTGGAGPSRPSARPASGHAWFYALSTNRTSHLPRQAGSPVADPRTHSAANVGKK